MRFEVLADRYEILEELGRGGMGAVFRAHDRVLDRQAPCPICHAEASGLLAR